jgi:hypothetical protein
MRLSWAPLLNAIGFNLDRTAVCPANHLIHRGESLVHRPEHFRHSRKRGGFHIVTSHHGPCARGQPKDRGKPKFGATFARKGARMSISR